MLTIFVKYTKYAQNEHRARSYELLRAPKPHTSKHTHSTVLVGHHSLHLCIIHCVFCAHGSQIGHIVDRHATTAAPASQDPSSHPTKALSLCTAWLRRCRASSWPGYARCGCGKLAQSGCCSFAAPSPTPPHVQLDAWYEDRPCRGPATPPAPASAVATRRCPCTWHLRDRS